METRVPRSVFREMISSAITPVTATARGSVYQDGEEITAIKVPLTYLKEHSHCILSYVGHVHNKNTFKLKKTSQ